MRLWIVYTSNQSQCNILKRQAIQIGVIASKSGNAPFIEEADHFAETLTAFLVDP
jgi:hypothetical protein